MPRIRHDAQQYVEILHDHLMASGIVLVNCSNLDKTMGQFAFDVSDIGEQISEFSVLGHRAIYSTSDAIRKTLPFMVDPKITPCRKAAEFIAFVLNHLSRMAAKGVLEKSIISIRSVVNRD